VEIRLPLFMHLLIVFYPCEVFEIMEDRPDNCLVEGTVLRDCFFIKEYRYAVVLLEKLLDFVLLLHILGYDSRPPNPNYLCAATLSNFLNTPVESFLI
jgi:hypothetical protein